MELLILHEKLSTFPGQVHVEIRWAMTGGREEKRLVLSWIESGGPEVCPPVRRGFGSKVISDMITHAFDGQVRLDYAPEGLSWRLDCALRNVEASFVS